MVYRHVEVYEYHDFHVGLYLRIAKLSVRLSVMSIHHLLFNPPQTPALRGGSRRVCFVLGIEGM